MAEQDWKIFWNKLREVIKSEGSSLRFKESRYWSILAGYRPVSGEHMEIALTESKNVVRVGLYIKNNKNFYDKIKSYDTEIKSKLPSLSISWLRDGLNGTSKASRISFNINGLDFCNRDNYESLMKEMIVKTVEFKKVIQEYTLKCVKNR